jgi:hypothetical protein
MILPEVGQSKVIYHTKKARLGNAPDVLFFGLITLFWGRANHHGHLATFHLWHILNLAFFADGFCYTL